MPLKFLPLGVAYLSNWFFMTPSIVTKFQYVNSLLFSFSLATCFGPYGPSSEDGNFVAIDGIVKNQLPLKCLICNANRLLFGSCIVRMAYCDKIHLYKWLPGIRVHIIQFAAYLCNVSWVHSQSWTVFLYSETCIRRNFARCEQIL
jgi:hypothetical protein